MLPKSFDYMEETNPEEDDNTETLPSNTYKMDLENGRVVGMTDGLDAVRQMVFKMLLTDRYSEIIYDENYGSDLFVLRGESIDYAEVLTPDYIESCLLQDDRVESVEDIVITQKDSDTLYVSFTVNTVYGSIPMQTEVKANG